MSYDPDPLPFGRKPVVRELDMTPDGRFRTPPRPAGIPLGVRVGGVALLVAVGAGALGLAALALWFALAIIPVALAAGVIAWGAFRFQLWRARRDPPAPGRTPMRR